MALVDLRSNLSFYGATPPTVNFFPDEQSGATGFTEYMQAKGVSPKPSQFVGVTTNTYTYPVSLFNHFNALNLQDASYNPTYTKHPIIVRGMQRKGKSNSTPQYWGYGSKSGFDDGLIRGGALTVADRVVADTERLAKFITSPKGILWSIKQVGLGLANPKVEVSPIAPIRQSRIHTGITSLLSVPGTPLGLHFTTHGIPFANEVSNYENVQKAKSKIWDTPVVGNRLLSLRKELGLAAISTGNSVANKVLGAIQSVQKILGFNGQVINSLSGLAGPNSLYGLGATTIRRYTDTQTDALQVAGNYNFNPAYSIANQYASIESKALITTKADDVSNNDIKTIDSSTPGISTSTGLNARITNYDSNSTPGNDKGSDISSADSRNTEYPNVKKDSISNYITLAYGKIPKQKSSNTLIDFRDLIAPQSNGQKDDSIIGQPPVTDYYKNYNLDTRYGFGKQGEVGADRTNPYQFLVTGSAFDGSINGRMLLVNTKDFRGDKINALDVATGKNKLKSTKDIYPNDVKDFIQFYLQDGDQGKNVLVFRATITSLQDSFSPGWEKLEIMGRPDGAYLYTSYERSISFGFKVAATSRSEMIPMWRKLNYLATYTMPNLQDANKQFGKASGPMMRITIGNLFQNTPGFIESLSYTVPEDGTWDIAEDYNTTDSQDPKQLPMAIEVSMTFKIISDFRPQLLGRAYSLSTNGNNSAGAGQWLGDSLDQNNK